MPGSTPRTHGWAIAAGTSVAAFVVAAPEPGSAPLLALGFAGLIGSVAVRHRRNHRRRD